MSKIVWLGTSVTKGTDYGGVTPATTFAQKIGVASGYQASEVVNKGVGSCTTSQMLDRLSADVLSHCPDVCVVETIPNDWALSVPLSAFEADIASIFGQLTGAGVKVVALNSSMKRGSQQQFLSYQVYLKAFEKQAAIAGAPLFDLYREMATSYLYLTSAQFGALYVDSIHLSVAGHQFVADLAAAPRYSGMFSPG